MSNKLIVIGLDGMTWDVARKSSMPNLEKLIQQGGAGMLRSTNPPVTCPAWPTYLTGKSPQNHEVYDFAYLDNDWNVQLNEYGDIQSPTLIDVMAETNTPSIFFEIPMTFPAPNIGPTIVSGYPSSLSEDKFSPSKLREQIEGTCGEYVPVSPTKFTGNNRDETLSALFSATRYRISAFTSLLKNEKWSFATINFHLSDQVGHYFWNEFEEDPKENAISEAYKLIDDGLGKIRNTIDDSTNIIVMSDHGHGKQSRTVNLNYHLIEEGFIELDKSAITRMKTFLTRWGLTPKNIKSSLDRLNLTQWIPDWGRETRDKILDKFLTFSDVNWNQTQSFAFGHVGQIYWIGDDNDELERLRNSLLNLSIDGKNMVSEIIPLREEPEASKERPLWLLNMEDWATISYPLFIGDWQLSQESTNQGCHRPEGILACAGPDLETLDKSVEAHIADIAPTIHHLLNLPPQNDFDGSIIDEVVDDSLPRLSPEKYGASQERSKDESKEERVDQLSDLGYL